jgi:hypothetical protein
MPRYLIELTHATDHITCVKVLDAIERQGSHLLTHLHWGCRTGIHSGWMIDEFASVEEARQIVPPDFREEARVVEVSQFSKADVAAMVEALEDE